MPMMVAPADFPIHEILPALLDTLAASTRLVLEAPPGAGKTTQVPIALLAAPWLRGRKILVLEPRRIAARAAAEFMARQLGEAVGETVGYRIRFESRVSAATRIEVITEGILTRMIQSDPELPGIGAILFDEFHERHLHADLGAALSLDVQANLREDLRLLIMSATLDGERIARWFRAPRLSSAGRSFPVRIEHPPARPNEDAMAHLRRCVEKALSDNDGDVLTFLPGKREIERARSVLSPLLEGAGGRSLEILSLHGEMALDQQRSALAPAVTGMRRIVLATNVAESSVTLPGIRAVVDAGQAREPRFDPNSGFTRLSTVAIAQSSADQRAGRAGRVAPGVAYRMWPQSARLEISRKAELLQVELSALALELAAWGSDDLDWLDAPPAGALAQARELLSLLGALAPDGRISDFGRRMLELGATPRLAAAALRAAPEQHALTADLLAAIDARSPLRGAAARSDDFRARIDALHYWRRGGARAAHDHAADIGALHALEQSAAGWRQRLRAGQAATHTGDSHAIGDLLLHAFPDRVAKQDLANPRRYALSNGRGARLHEESALFGEPWLIVLDLRHEERDSLILAAAPFDPRGLSEHYPQRLILQRAVRWNDAKRAAEAFEEQRFGALVLERRQVAATAADALPGLLAAVRSAGLSILPWSEGAQNLRLRVECLREWCPELKLPDLGDNVLLNTLELWLAPVLAGKSRLDALRSEELGHALTAMLDHAQRRSVDEQAPVALRVPTGNERRLDYAPGQPPVIAVKLQELFGLADTPRIAQGRVAVTLHLLSPAQRPIQVTQDLKGFWERTYPEVKKELKGRYPRHPWPDDPWSATPTARAKPRR
ncbi:MAG: ATP-dependent helicase HrpB [Tahibacter sp.]